MTCGGKTLVQKYITSHHYSICGQRFTSQIIKSPPLAIEIPIDTRTHQPHFTLSGKTVAHKYCSLYRCQVGHKRLFVLAIIKFPARAIQISANMRP